MNYEAKFFDGPLAGLCVSLPNSAKQLMLTLDNGSVYRYETDYSTIDSTMESCRMVLTRDPDEFDDELLSDLDRDKL